MTERGKGVLVTVHRLVARLFIGPIPSDCVVVHINGDQSDNRSLNLYFAPRNYRCFGRDAEHLFIGRQKMTFADATQIWQRANAGESMKELSAQFSVSRNTVSQIKNGRTWRRIHY